MIQSICLIAVSLTACVMIVFVGLVSVERLKRQPKIFIVGPKAAMSAMEWSRLSELGYYTIDCQNTSPWQPQVIAVK